jgi:mannose-6-phosphate isomerase-like protein (cupin superfamily)
MLTILAAGAAYVFIGALLDSVLLPEEQTSQRYYPATGQSFHSNSEGFQQTVVKRENGLFWVELEMRPHAPGPPEHVHATFTEKFVVTEGTMTMLFNGEKRTLHAGETLEVPPGTPHKPFNETDARVVVRGPMTLEYAMPERFSVFLTQAYGFFDESPANGQMPKALLQMSRFGPEYDAWLADIPLPAQKALFFLIRPTARLLGYRTHYERFAPKAQLSRQ